MLLSLTEKGCAKWENGENDRQLLSVLRSLSSTEKKRRLLRLFTFSRGLQVSLCLADEKWWGRTYNPGTALVCHETNCAV